MLLQEQRFRRKIVITQSLGAHMIDIDKAVEEIKSCGEFTALQDLHDKYKHIPLLRLEIEERASQLLDTLD